VKHVLKTGLVFVFASVAIGAQTFYGTTDIKTYRNGRDGELRDKEKSPLKKVDFPKYTGLNYYPLDFSYRVFAKFKRTKDEKRLSIPTSSGKIKRYVKYAVLKFEVRDKPYTLDVYHVEKSARKGEYKHLLFIPFKDLTNGRGSYGGGRYLFINDTKKSEVILDFNLASNPSCAYGSDRYSCPIPPRANHLKTRIKAGEKIYHYSKAKK